MTVQLDWPPDVVARLTEEAAIQGLCLDDYILRTVMEIQQMHVREEAGRSIRQLRKGNILGPDLTVKDLLEEGRRF